SVYNMLFDLGLVVGNPFYLATLGLAAVGWIVEFAGAAASKVEGVAWFYIVYELFIIIGIFAAIATNALNYYRISFILLLCVFIGRKTLNLINYQTQIVSLLAIGISFQINIITFDIGISLAQFQAFAAGALFITIVSLVWIISLGAEDGSLVGDTINSWSINSKPTNPRNVHPDVGFPPGVQLNSGQMNMPDQVVVSPNADYAYKAKALYDYQANPEDHTELSFTKGEVLDIVDNKGKWWQAKKADGTI
ncbi:10327_t:CDS:2, partial [Scutellospora calospora]